MRPAPLKDRKPGPLPLPIKDSVSSKKLVTKTVSNIQSKSKGISIHAAGPSKPSSHKQLKTRVKIKTDEGSQRSKRVHGSGGMPSVSFYPNNDGSLSRSTANGGGGQPSRSAPISVSPDLSQPPPPIPAPHHHHGPSSSGLAPASSSDHYPKPKSKPQATLLPPSSPPALSTQQVEFSPSGSNPPVLPAKTGGTQQHSGNEETGEDSSSSDEEEEDLPRKMTLSERFGKLAQLSSQRQEYDGVRMKIVREGGQDKKVYLEAGLTSR